MIPASPEHFHFGDFRFTALIPEENHIRQEMQTNPGMPFPYWSRVWHSAIGLCKFLSLSTHLIQNKNILEVGAGLGIPSLLSSFVANEVVASDNSPAAVEMINRSAE